MYDFLNRLRTNRIAAVTPLMAFGSMMIFWVTGLTVDAGRAYYVRERLITALDAAALAGARDIITSPTTVQDKAIRYFWANFPTTCSGTQVTTNISCAAASSASMLGSQFAITSTSTGGTDNPRAVLLEGGTQLQVTATVTLPTMFMSAKIFNQAGFGTLSIGSAGTAGIGNLELTMVLDNTGSMAWGAGSTSQSKMSALQCAAINMLRGLYAISSVSGSQCTTNPPSITTSGSTASFPNVWVNLVPSVAGVNIGPQHYGWVDWSGTGVNGTGEGGKATRTSFADDDAGTCQTVNGKSACGTVTTPSGGVPGWKGCVEARPGPDGTYEDTNADQPPSAKLWTPYYWDATASATLTNPAYNASNTIMDDFPPVLDANGNAVKISLTVNGKATSFNIGGDNNWIKGHPETIYYGSVAEAYDLSNDETNPGTGPNLGCGSPIQVHMTQEGAMETAITSMYPVFRAGTLDNLGLAWGWRTVSPKWAGVWDSQTAVDGTALPLPYGKSQKVIILLTDGLNTYNDWGGSQLALCPDNTTVIPHNNLILDFQNKGFKGYSCSSGTPTVQTASSGAQSGKYLMADGIGPSTAAPGGLPIGAQGNSDVDYSAAPYSFSFGVTSGVQNGGDYNAYGRLGSNSILTDSGGNHISDINTGLNLVITKQAALCTAIKAASTSQPIQIFTIILGTDAPLGTTTATLFQNCSSDGTQNVGFFDPATTDNLNSVFQTILTQLSIPSIVS